MRISLLTLSLLLASHCSTAYGEVLDSADNGFSLKHKVTIKATPEEVYETIIKPSLWWNSSHTWSGKSENLSIETTPGGLFLEKLPSGGFVRHIVHLLNRQSVQVGTQGDATVRGFGFTPHHCDDAGARGLRCQLADTGTRPDAFGAQHRLDVGGCPVLLER